MKIKVWMSRNETIEPLGDGMTMRQWYKGQALQGVLAGNIPLTAAVLDASLIADAMIAEDEKHAKGGAE